MADDDRIVLYVSTTGTHRGSFMGAPPTGKKFKVNGTDIFRFNDDGKVVAHWGVFDTLECSRNLVSFRRRVSPE